MLPALFKQVLDNFNFDIDPALSREESIEEVIKSAALLSGAIAVEPIPFADILLITPVQAKMVLHIGKIYGFEVTAERAQDIVKELGATVAFGMAARQVMRGLAKMALPLVGGLITAPAVYGWTYALGRMADQYFQRKRVGLPFGERDRTRVAQEAKRTARNVLPTARDFNDLAAELRRRAEQREKSAGDDRSAAGDDTQSRH